MIHVSLPRKTIIRKQYGLWTAYLPSGRVVTARDSETLRSKLGHLFRNGHWYF